MDKSKYTFDYKFLASYIIFLLICIIVWLNWNKYPTISKHDLISQSHDTLITRLLEITPIGTSVEDSKFLIKEKLNRECVLIERESFHGFEAKNRHFKTMSTDSAFILECNLTNYGWAQNFFCGGDIIDGLWLFNADNKLEEVAIHHWRDGM